MENTKYYSNEAYMDVTKDINKNAFQFIDDATKDFGNLTALTYFKNQITYDEWKKNVFVYANNLLSYGLQKGDCVTLVLPNTPELTYYKYAAWVLGIKICPIDPRTDPAGIQYLINSTKSKLVIAILDKYKEKIVPILDHIKVDNIVLVSPTDSMGVSPKAEMAKKLYEVKEIILNTFDKQFASGRVKLNTDFIDTSKNNILTPVYEPDENGMPAAAMFTSGSEGTPKAALHSHESYNAKAKQISYALPKLEPGDKFLGIIPFFSAYGSFDGMHICLYKGMNISLIPQFNANKVPELICEEKPNVLIAVPNYWHDFSERIDNLMVKYKLEDLSFIKYPVSGGDKQPKKDVIACNEKFRQYGSDAYLLRGYGSTEVGGAIATTVADEEYEDGEYTGIPMPGTDIKIADDGEIMVSDPAVMMEYLGNEKETNNSIVEIDGKRYMKMGDYFRQDDMGRLHFEGRKKRAIMRPDGHTVHALPIEETIELSDLVDKCCVVGLKKQDGSSGAIPTAFVVLKENVNKNMAAQEIDKIALQHLSERNRALAYVFVDDLPATLMHKIDFRKLEENYIEDVDYYAVDFTFLKSRNKSLKLKMPKLIK